MCRKCVWASMCVCTYLCVERSLEWSALYETFHLTTNNFSHTLKEAQQQHKPTHKNIDRLAGVGICVSIRFLDLVAYVTFAINKVPNFKAEQTDRIRCFTLLNINKNIPVLDIVRSGHKNTSLSKSVYRKTFCSYF